MGAVSNAAKYNHYLIVNDDQGKREYILTESKYSIGRKSDCTIILDSQFVSRLHATLLRCLHNNGESYYRLLDGDGYQKTSANGLRVNGAKVAVHELKDGDEIIFGPQIYAVYKYHLVDKASPLEQVSIEEDPFDITLLSPSMMQKSEFLPNEDEITILLGPKGNQ